jgi:hypothetical protein
MIGILSSAGHDARFGYAYRPRGRLERIVRPFMTESSLLDVVAPVDQFRAMVIGDPALQLRLSRLEGDEDFVTAAIDVAAAAGIALDLDMLHVAMRPDPLGLRRFSGAAITSRAAPEGHWLPGAVVPSVGELAVDWAHFADTPLSEPFFEESLRQKRHLPLNRLVQPRTPLATLEAAAGENAPAPAGFVFHLSRCGSTLVSQMLAADPRNIVVSEAAPIDSIVQLGTARPDVPIEERARLLRAMVGALGRGRVGDGGAYVVKLDSWHTIALPLFRIAFPDTPWLFLYRDPIEILVSHARMPGAQTVFGALPFDPYGIENGAAMHPDEYAACALGRIATAVVEHIGLGGGLLVNYADLPGAMETRILPHFDIALDEAGRAALIGALGRDAKSPNTGFTGDSEAKQRAASTELRANAAAWLDEPYRLLEALRVAGQE